MKLRASDIRSRNDIITIASKHFSVVDNKICCPFHGEKTPSLIFNRAKQTFHCFGCGEHGDVIDFTQKLHDIDFFEALEMLSANDSNDDVKVVTKQEVKQINENNRLEAIRKAKWILSQCKLDYHQYLGKKGFQEGIGNVWSPNDETSLLVVPTYSFGKIVGCQLIDKDGNKRFLKGQQVIGTYFKIGTGQRKFFVEGYATGLSLQSILCSLREDYVIYVCFNSLNLPYLASKVNGFVIADNDESQIGEQAAIDSFNPYWMPPVVGMDINDYLNKVGIFKVSMELKEALLLR